MKKTLMLYTGGTIGMKPSAKGLVPVTGFFEKYLRSQDFCRSHKLPEFDFIEFKPVLDSSQIQPQIWNDIADRIIAHYDDYDGFMIVHGTDTMAYTSSALSFMLRNLDKPVVMTGAMYSIVDSGSDGPGNILGAFDALTFPANQQVCVYFAGHLFPGSHITKMDSMDHDAFAAPVSGPLDLRFHYNKTGSGDISLFQAQATHIDILHFYPGAPLSTLANMVASDSKAIVLRSYGSGNGPDNPDFYELLKQAQQKRKLIINSSQCFRPLVNMARYGAGAQLLDSGAIGSQTMTLEAIITKLTILFSNFEELETIKQQFETPWAMEYPN
ncbi:asparaginase [Gynuella sp.]|uniref:asparaginase n=1 Tax=Gynuella sp. TaxID=2969146 RepID=UPI003D152685